MQSRAIDTILRDRCLSSRENKPELIHQNPHTCLRWGMCMVGGCEKSHQIIVKSVPTTQKEIFSLAVCYFSLPSSCLLVFLVHSNLHSKFYLYFLLLFSTTFSTFVIFLLCRHAPFVHAASSPSLCTDEAPLPHHSVFR